MRGSELVFCKWCGKAIRDNDNYCPNCGGPAWATQSPPPVAPCYRLREDRRDLAIAAVLFVLVFVLPMVLSALMYVAVLGAGPSSNSWSTTPSAGLNVIDKTTEELTFAVVALHYSYVDLDDVRLELSAPGGQVVMDIGSTSSSPNVYTVESAGILLTFQDEDGDGCLTSGDLATVSSTLPLVNGAYSLSLTYIPTGGTIAQQSTEVP